MQYNNGNVLFIVLIAVALFAALSYAVTSSTRSGNSSTSKEAALTNAAAIIQYGAMIRQSVMRMKISNGCTDSMIDISNPIYIKADGTSTNTANANAPADKRCNLFDPAGGGMSAVVAPPAALDDAYNLAAQKSGHGIFRITQIQGVGTSGTTGIESFNELTFSQAPLKKQTCIAINEMLNVNNPSGSPPVTSVTGANGVFTNGSFAGSGLMNNVNINGQIAFCYCVGSCIFVQTVIDR